MLYATALRQARRLRILAAFACICLATGCVDSTAADTAEKSDAEIHSSGEQVVVSKNSKELIPSGPQALDKTGSETSATVSTNGLFMLATGAALVALASTALSAYLLLWRRRLPDGQISLLPEQVMTQMQQLASANTKFSQAASAQQNHALSKFGEVQKSFEIFGALVAEKDKQIERLQQGSDKRVYLQFLKRFVRVLNLVDSDIMEDEKVGKDTTALRSLRGYLVDALLDTGVEEFSLPNGTDYRNASGVADKPDVIETTDPSQDWKISATVRPGFQIRTAEQAIVIESARVQILRVRTVGA